MRNAGFTGAIAVEPTNYAGWAQVTGAGWSGFAGLNDPSGKLIFEVHGYFDSNDSGTSTNDASSTTTAASNLQNVVNFQNANGSQFIGIYLGETGPGETNNTIDATFRAVGDNVYKVVSSNAADFFAVTLYGAGQEWPSSYVDNENPIPNFGSVTNAVGYQQAVNDLEPLVLYLGEDAYQGDAQATVAVDNVQVWAGAIAADRLANTPQPVGLFGALTSGTHTITVNFTNDAYGGSVGADRNLFVDGATYAGTKATADGFAPIYANGSSTFHVTVP